MIGRIVVGAAVVLYLIVLGCVALQPPTGAGGATARQNSASGSDSTDSRPSHPLDGLPYRGAAIQIQRVDWLDKYKKSIDEIADMGFDTVSFVVDSRQENGSSCRIYIDMRMTPTPDQLGDLIQHAKAKKLRVILMPIVLLDAPRGNEWRGTIKPEDWEGENGWFESYRAMLTHFAWIAEQNKVDVMSVGSELVSTENKLSEWKKTIKKVREIYHGRLTYSANWDHYTSIRFWDQLDLIGMNSYYKLGDDRNVTVAEIVSRWKDIQTDLLSFQQQIGKPILFLEIGWCSLANAADEPWDYTQTDLNRDDELQKKLYEGFFQAWYQKPGLGGFMVWEWTPGDGGNAKEPAEAEGGERDAYNQQIKGYTPENKPAEKVIRDWLKKPWGNTAASAS